MPDSLQPGKTMLARSSYRQICARASATAALLSVTLLLGYIAFGHALIQAGYHSDLPVFHRMFAGRAVTSLQEYFAAFDRSALVICVYFALSAIGLLLLANPLGSLISGVSFSLVSLTAFLLLDRFPELVKPLHFDMIPYFNYRLTYVPDPVLGFRERANHAARITNFRGFAYSPLYGIDVRPQTVDWRTDQDGFRNPPKKSSADVVMIGSSFLEYGTDLEDTYPMRLERELKGPKVVNLGKAGYGPLEYVKVLERYALKKHPQYALLALSPPSDVDGHLADWVKGKTNYSLNKRSIAFAGFFPRYDIAIAQTWQMLSTAAWTRLWLEFERTVGTQFVQPDVAVLKLPGNVTKKIVFFDRHRAQAADDLLRSAEWQELKKILIEFKRLSKENHIVPVIVYIPVATEVYAEFSTLDSGANWLRDRQSQIASRNSNEEAAERLAARVGIDLISFTPAFRQAARRGELLYYSLDSHWNTAGRQIAARVTAEALETIHADAVKSHSPPKTPEDFRKPDPVTQQAALDANESIMTRAIDGKINFWNRGAEELYGWSREEAVGRVSHDLLRTRFPEPLDKIDAELIQSGHWRGQLVHTARDGRRIVVDSRWLLKTRKANSEVVVEINTPTG